MRKVSEKDYQKYIISAKNSTANKVYPCSIAEGFQAGDIYVNDGTEVESVFFWHFCGFGYISGRLSQDFLTEVYAEMLSEEKNRRLVLITDDEYIMHFFEDKGVQMDVRVEYSYVPSASRVSSLKSNRFRIEQINEENISKIRGRIIPSFSWKNRESFLERGFGYIALEGENVCAVAFSSAVSSEEIDIGVETLEEYRGNGLASALAGRMCEHIIDIGKQPVWAHASSNIGSMKTALACGFVERKRNTSIRKR